MCAKHSHLSSHNLYDDPFFKVKKKMQAFQLAAQTITQVFPIGLWFAAQVIHTHNILNIEYIHTEYWNDVCAKVDI